MSGIHLLALSLSFPCALRKHMRMSLSKNGAVFKTICLLLLFKIAQDSVLHYY